jgi:hypothetical protein
LINGLRCHPARAQGRHAEEGSDLTDDEDALAAGLRHYSRLDLEAIRAAGKKLHIQVLDLAVIASDVSPDLARASN